MRTDEMWWTRQRSSLTQAYADENPEAVAARLRELLDACGEEHIPDNVVAFLDAAYLLAESRNLPRSQRAWRLAMHALH